MHGAGTFGIFCGDNGVRESIGDTLVLSIRVVFFFVSWASLFFFLSFQGRFYSERSWKGENKRIQRFGQILFVSNLDAFFAFYIAGKFIPKI